VDSLPTPKPVPEKGLARICFSDHSLLKSGKLKVDRRNRNLHEMIFQKRAPAHAPPFSLTNHRLDFFEKLAISDRKGSRQGNEFWVNSLANFQWLRATNRTNLHGQGQCAPLSDELLGLIKALHFVPPMEQPSFEQVSQGTEKRQREFQT
jgi:hypothetical protein